VISDPKSGSESLHSHFGFRKVGHLEKIGFKFGQWIDVVVMQRATG
jgi:L-amino acid N-acyltransferase YncA